MSIAITDFDPQGPFAILMPKPVRQRLRQNDTKRFKNWRPLPFFQRGNLNMLFALFDDADASGSVVMTNGTWTKTNLAALVHAGVTFDKDGTTHELGAALGDRTAHQSGEWWSAEPDTDIGASYDVRGLSTGKTGAWSVSAAADDTWIDISVERIWRETRTAKAAPGSSQTIQTFEIRTTGSGSALDSAVYNVTATN